MSGALTLAIPARGIRISGNRNDCDFWRIHFTRPPLVTLDGVPVQFVCEARSGKDGYVVVELQHDSKPALADVVFNGEIIDRIIPRRTIHGDVVIEPVPEHLS